MRTCIILPLLFIYSLSYSQPESNSLPVYQGKDLKIDSKRLVPFRLQYWPRSERLDTLFRNAQISHTVERSDYYKQGEPKQGIRIRWVSNTHSFEDKAYVDASTFGIITNSATLNIKKESFVHTYFGDKKVVRTILRNDSLSSGKIHDIQYSDYYHLIIMPYLFASSDLDAGSQFKLPFFSGVREKESLIIVNVIGPYEYTNKYGEKRDSWRVDTDHGYAKIEWYLDKFRPPYLLAYKWKSVRDGKVTNESSQSIVKWWEYQGDDFDRITIPK